VFLTTHLDLLPGSGGEITIRTLEGVGIQVGPLVVLHVRASVERLHAYAAGKPLGAQTGRALSRGRGGVFAAQLRDNRGHGQRGGVRDEDRSLHSKTTHLSLLPPPVAEHHQAVPTSSSTSHFSGFPTRRLLQPEKDCPHRCYCKDNSFMTLQIEKRS